MDYHLASKEEATEEGPMEPPQTKRGLIAVFILLLYLYIDIYEGIFFDWLGCRCRCIEVDLIYCFHCSAGESGEHPSRVDAELRYRGSYGFTRKQVVNEANRVKVEADPDKGVWLWFGETAVPSSSCSFFTIDDEGSSSTTTTQTNILPGGTYRRITTNFYKGRLLGRGSFGSVYEGMTDDGFFIAIKEVSLLDQGDMGRQIILYLEQEIALLSQFEHENIVRFFGTAKDDSNLYIFLELMTKGSLANLYQTYHLRDSQVSSYTRQILSGLKYLHDRNVVHRDIKCANILVHANGIVKLADFGLAKATPLNDVRSCKGTAFWMAPEVVNVKDRGYGLPADIWSLGCTVLEMLTRRVPYFPSEWMQALFRIGRGEPPPLPDSLSRDAGDFILQCIRVNPDDRPTAAQLLGHPFVNRPVVGLGISLSPSR